MDGTIRELSLAPIHPNAPATDPRYLIRLEDVGDTLILGRLSEAPLGYKLESGIQNMLVHRKHAQIGGAPPVLTVLGAHSCTVINSARRLELTQGQSCVLGEFDEIHLIDMELAQKLQFAKSGTDYTGDTCAYRVDCAAPLQLQPIAPDGRAYRRGLQLNTTTQLRLGRAAGSGGVTDPRVSRLHARICAPGPGPLTVTAEGTHPCVLVKAHTGAQQLP